jgi:hypothetical protein
MRVVVHGEPVVPFGIRCPRIVRLDTVATIEPEAIRSENTTTFGRVLLNPVLRGLLHEATQRLNRGITLTGRCNLPERMQRLTLVRRHM